MREIHSSGAPIPGAVIRLSNTETAAKVEVVSDAQGSYSAIALTPGGLPIGSDARRVRTHRSRGARYWGQPAEIDVTLKPARITEGVIVTARRVEEVAQEVPIPVSVIDGNLVADAGAFNVNRLKELVPTVQFYSSNPRNS